MKRVKQTRRRGFTRLSGKRQVTLPLRVVKALDLHPGDELKVEADGDRIVLSPEQGRKANRLLAIHNVAGSLSHLWKPGDLQRLRNEWR